MRALLPCLLAIAAGLLPAGAWAQTYVGQATGQEAVEQARKGNRKSADSRCTGNTVTLELVVNGNKINGTLDPGSGGAKTSFQTNRTLDGTFGLNLARASEGATGHLSGTLTATGGTAELKSTCTYRIALTRK
jgi:hypothetical protein